jgi:hypothetical protein
MLGAGMRVFIVASVALFLTFCAARSGWDSVRNVEESKLRGQTMTTVVEMLGSPFAYYVVPDGREHILVYDTIAISPGLTPETCGIISIVGSCPKIGNVLEQCVALRFGRDKQVVDIDRPTWLHRPCSAESDDRFLPATRHRHEWGHDIKLDDGVNVLSEEELLILFVGNTAFNSTYSEYYEPSSGDKNEGQLRGNHNAYGTYSGNWSVKGQQFCWEFDRISMPAFGASIPL